MQEESIVDMDKVFLKIEGMVQKRGFTWMGWPDAIVSTLEGMEGIEKMVFLPEKEVFELSFISNVISMEMIFEKIVALGKKRNLTYKSFLIPMA